MRKDSDHTGTFFKFVVSAGTFGRHLQALVLFTLAMLSALFVSVTPVRADVIMSGPSPSELTLIVSEEETTGVSTLQSWRSPQEEAVCNPGPKSGCELTAFTVQWEPDELPASVQIVRDANGVRASASLMIRTAQARLLCHTELKLNDPNTVTAVDFGDDLKREVKAWLDGCGILPEAMHRSLEEAWADSYPGLLPHLAMLWAARDKAFVPNDHDGYSYGSFLPKKIDQHLLDLVALACGADNRPTLSDDGSITWTPDNNQINPPGGYSPDSCVTSQIRYYPGYPKAD